MAREVARSTSIAFLSFFLAAIIVASLTGVLPA
jgi:hypothetical protein